MVRVPHGADGARLLAFTRETHYDCQVFGHIHHTAGIRGPAPSCSTPRYSPGLIDCHGGVEIDTARDGLKNHRMLPPQDIPQVSIIIPTLNEADNIRPLVTDICAAVGSSFPFEILVIDGGSTDGTQEQVRALEPDYPVRVIAWEGKGGLSGAVLSGAGFARGTVVVVLDGDQSHPAECIPKLVQPVMEEACDLAIGSRYVSGGSTPDFSLWRRIVSRVASAMAWPLTDVRDPMSGFFAVRRDRMLAAIGEMTGFKIGLELLVQGGGRLRVTEIPITFLARRHGKSKLNAAVMGQYLIRLVALAVGPASAGINRRTMLAYATVLLADLLIFLGLSLEGASLGSAQVASFTVAMAVHYLLNTRPALLEARRLGRRGGSSPGLRFVCVCVLALFARGGILAQFGILWGWPPAASIVMAIPAGAAVLYLGRAWYASAGSSSPSPDIRWRIAALGAAVYLITLKLSYAGLLDLLPEEAYYWNYAQHLAAGYLDHPPMIAWLIFLGTSLFGHSEFGVRAGSTICWAIAAGFAFALSRHLLDKSAAFRTLMLMAALPFFFAIGLFMTPDAPLVACWAGALYFLESALLRERRAAWLGAGICLGLGLLSKYTIALLGPATLLFLIMDRRSRRWFLRPEPYLCTAVALLLLTPVIVWNAQHDWASFVFQGPRRLHDEIRFSLDALCIAVLVILTPIGVGSLVLAIIQHNASVRRTMTNMRDIAPRENLFMLVFLLVPLAVFVLFSLFHKPKLNWTGPAWLAVLPLIAWHMTASNEGRFPRINEWMKRAWAPMLVTLMMLYGGALHYFVLGLPGLPYPEHMILLGWRGLGRQVDAIVRDVVQKTGEEPIVTGLDRYMISSELAFYSRRQGPSGRTEQGGGEPAHFVPVIAGRHLFGHDALMFEYWNPKEAYTGRTIIMITRKEEDIGDDQLSGYFEHLDPPGTIAIDHYGRLAATYYYRIGYGYRPGSS
jgi:dolichol-phosphate mannosyltransferase